MKERQQNTTSHPITFLLVQSSDHVTGLTGATPTVTISKDGGSFAAAAGAVTEVGNGLYKLAGNATDRNTLGSFDIHVTATSGDPCDEKYQIVGYDPFDAVRLGLTALPNVASGSAGAIPTTGTGANQIQVDGSGGVSHVVLTDTATALTGKTGFSLAAGGIGVTAFAAGSITVGAFAAGAINSTAIGSGALDAGNFTNAYFTTGIANAVWDAAASGHTTAGTYGTVELPQAAGTVASTTGTTTTLDTGAVAATDYHKGALLLITGGTGAGQARVITAYSSGRAATHAAWTTNPNSASVYRIVPAFANVVAYNAVATTVDTDVTAIKVKTDQFVFTTTNRVDSTVVDKTGFSLTATGLDSIPITAPAGPAGTFREMVVATWRWDYKKRDLTATQEKTYADDNTTVLTTQTVSNDGTTQIQGAAS